MATSKQGWPTQKEAAKAARSLRRIGYKARVSRRKIKGFYRIIYSAVGKAAMAKYRTFKGVRFQWVASLPRRDNAELEARVRRKRGQVVRVIPIKGGYALYAR